jgi:hypothetical protein
MSPLLNSIAASPILAGGKLKSEISNQCRADLLCPSTFHAAPLTRPCDDIEGLNRRRPAIDNSRIKYRRTQRHHAIDARQRRVEAIAEIDHHQALAVLGILDAARHERLGGFVLVVKLDLGAVASSSSLTLDTVRSCWCESPSRALEPQPPLVVAALSPSARNRTTEASDKMAAEAFAVETLNFAVDRSKRRWCAVRSINARQHPASSERKQGNIHSGLSSRIWLRATNTMSPITAMKNTVGKSSPSIMAGQ